MDKESLIGRVAYSKAGRDFKRPFVIVGILNEQYVSIVDGGLRKVEKPKKKKMKHLLLTDKINFEFQKAILSGEKVSNSVVINYLQSEDINKEV